MATKTRKDALMQPGRVSRPRGDVQEVPGITADAPPLLTLTDAAFRIGVDRATAYQWVLLGIVPGAVRIRKRWWVRTRLLDDWLARSRQRRKALTDVASWPRHS